MKIKEIESQYRRDFWAIYICEYCEYETRRSGYDDTYCHQKVIPGMKCPKCGRKSPENYRPLQTKYPDSVTV